jgi:predicted metalloprotease with PDZ domain
MELFFSISQSNPVSHYINVKLKIQNVVDKKLILLLPRWRPGRYELGHFSKNIQNFRAYDSKGKQLLVIKSNTHSWEIFNDNLNKEIFVEYNYYANEYNAGACYADENILYFNPVHLLMKPSYSDTIHKFHIHINVPKNYKIITSLKIKIIPLNLLIMTN